ncbi:MAG TPA: N-acetylmuramoyl-L-alanine amidase [Candidatus Sulfotelmatobacter sp.]|nr:N-acetylmuramoyl-L-alanine amidase [Candidatus Sulfotelmatobacter sp.]
MTTTASSGRSLRGLRCGWLLLITLILSLPAAARARHGESWAREHFANAEKMREALNGRPADDRTRHDYQRVINAYRSVYYGAPSSSKADPSAVATAEVLVEMGRHFEDEKILNSAIGQYRFLRREYPGSKYRCDALFTIGEIYKEDLDRPDQAREAFQEFLRRYPHNRLAEDARNAIAELDQPVRPEKLTQEQEARAKQAQEKNSERPAQQERAAGKSGSSGAEDTAATQKLAQDEGMAEAQSKTDAPPASKTPRVTRIRHWSTPDSTRVALDLESDVKFHAERLTNPDRIFFDLRGTRLASTLVGKTFDVDDGFLKKIRVAQFQPGRSRIVLEVKDLSDYEAFLVPNPYRLIIDIHGKNAKGKLPKAPAKPSESETQAAKETIPAASTPDEAGAADETKSGLMAKAGKAPASGVDLGDRAQIADSKSGAEHSAPTSNVSAPVKKVIDADEDDQTEEPVTPKRTKLSVSHQRSRASSQKAFGKTADAAADESADSAPAPATKVSATRHTLVSRTRRTPPADESDSLGDIGTREAQPTASGDRSLIRALGLKIGKIVIDPGHGGHDTGTIGPNGLEEKDLVLEVGRRLGKLLQTRLGAEVVYTRRNDTFIPLETRTAIANQQRADLFISIHANSSRDPDARGVETYYLNFTSSPEALEVAARENAVSEKSIYELQDLVKKIALKEKIEESREFAADVQQSLHSGLAAKSPSIRNRGVKKAPFIVLIGANMPSILAEISFVSNPTDERRLETGEYRQNIAESLYRGIAKYAHGLSGVKVASKMEKGNGGQ